MTLNVALTQRTVPFFEHETARLIREPAVCFQSVAFCSLDEGSVPLSRTMCSIEHFASGKSSSSGSAGSCSDSDGFPVTEEAVFSRIALATFSNSFLSSANSFHTRLSLAPPCVNPFFP